MDILNMLPSVDTGNIGNDLGSCDIAAATIRVLAGGTVRADSKCPFWTFPLHKEFVPFPGRIRVVVQYVLPIIRTHCALAPASCFLGSLFAISCPRPLHFFLILAPFVDLLQSSL